MRASRGDYRVEGGIAGLVHEGLAAAQWEVVTVLAAWL
jgi:hypothetical protein